MKVVRLGLQRSQEVPPRSMLEVFVNSAAFVPPPIRLTLDGRPVVVPAGTTIWEAARRHGLAIPVLCHQPHLQPVGVCRLCVVDVGGRVLAAACIRPCSMSA